VAALHDATHRRARGIANAVMFLAAPETGWITAQMLTVDGGRMDYIGHG
jgi:NAD(P)-dependent dehydrogenase (short-subunit alcohol dehydrogenase family)